MAWVTYVNVQKSSFSGVFALKGNRWSRGYFLLLYKNELKQGMVKACQRCGGWGGCLSLRKAAAQSWGHLSPEWQVRTGPPAFLNVLSPTSPVIDLRKTTVGTQGFLPLFSSLKSSYILFFFFNTIDFLEKMRPREQRWRYSIMTTQAAAPKQSKEACSREVCFLSLWLYSIFHLYLKLSWWIWIQIFRVTVESYLFMCMDSISQFKRESS